MRAYRHSLWGWAVVAVLLSVGRGAAQGPTISSSSVGYIDPAIPGTYLRLRFDDVFNDTLPSRGEFLLARTPGAGLPLPERRVDYQDLSVYQEFAIDPQISLFAEVPYRLMNPEVNLDHSGLSDISAGFKWALVYDQNLVVTLQFLGRFPTGDAHLGLGDGHVSLEPALLGYFTLISGLALEGELCYTAPIGGTSGYASNVVSYGVGLKYDLYKDEELGFAPVVEVVGWTFLDGKKTLLLNDGSTVDVSASGDTIVNIKAGARLSIGGLGDLYVGWGRPVTGTTRYGDMYRVEFRMTF